MRDGGKFDNVNVVVVAVAPATVRIVAPTFVRGGSDSQVET